MRIPSIVHNCFIDTWLTNEQVKYQWLLIDVYCMQEYCYSTEILSSVSFVIVNISEIMF